MRPLPKFSEPWKAGRLNNLGLGTAFWVADIVNRRDFFSRAPRGTFRGNLASRDCTVGSNFWGTFSELLYVCVCINGRYPWMASTGYFSSSPQGSALGIDGLGWNWVCIAGPGPYSIVYLHIYIIFQASLGLQVYLRLGQLKGNVYKSDTHAHTKDHPVERLPFRFIQTTHLGMIQQARVTRIEVQFDHVPLTQSHKRTRGCLQSDALRVQSLAI